MANLVPSLSKEELLSKTIVETRPSKEYEFGYMITEDELEIRFVRDESMFNFFSMITPEDQKY